MKNMNSKQQGVIQGKSDALFEHLVYSLATGRWQVDERLPSVRQAEKEWLVNRLTVLACYKRLELAGLIIAKGRSGYFVLGGASLDDLSRHRFELENIYTKVLTLLEQETSLLPSIVFKSLSELSGFRVRQQPEIAFVECSFYQANYHAKECQNHFQIPITPISLNTFDDEPLVFQPSVRCLLTTGFHFHQVSSRTKKSGLPIIQILIQIDQEKLITSVKDKQLLCLFERELPIGESILADISAVLTHKAIQLKVGINLEQQISTYLESSSEAIALLPPRVYGAVNKELQQDPRVIVIDYKIIENQWQVIANALKLSMDWFIATN